VLRSRNTIRFLALAGVLLAFATTAAAIGNELIPLDDWSYKAIERMEALGLCLLPDDRPFSRTEMSDIVTEISKKAFDRRLSARDKYNLGRLEKEFTEFSSRRDPQYRYDPPTFYVQDSPLVLEGDVDIGASFERAFLGDDEVFLKSSPQFRIHIGERVTMDARYRFVFGPEHGDRARDNKPSRREKSFKGLTSLYERGYTIVGFDKLHVFFGRAEIDWGPGHIGNLITPGQNLTVDQLGFRIRLKRFRLNFFHGQLSPVSSRYFAGHRLEFRIANTVVGVSETTVYHDKDVDPLYMFPLVSFYANQFNERGNDDNVLWAVDAKTTLRSVATLYASLLIDDAQFEREDGAPDKLALDVGGRVAISNPVEMTFRGNYRFVDIFTYTHKDSSNNYVGGEGLPDEGDALLGGEPGPDGDAWRLEAEYYPRPNMVAGVFVFRERRGEGEDFRPHITGDDPDPDFPSGTAQHTHGFGATVRYEFDRNRTVGAAWSYARFYNIGHVGGLGDSDNAFKVFVNWEFL